MVDCTVQDTTNAETYALAILGHELHYKGFLTLAQWMLRAAALCT